MVVKNSLAKLLSPAKARDISSFYIDSVLNLGSDSFIVSAVPGGISALVNRLGDGKDRSVIGSDEVRATVNMMISSCPAGRAKEVLKDISLADDIRICFYQSHTVQYQVELRLASADGRIYVFGDSHQSMNHISLDDSYAVLEKKDQVTFMVTIPESPMLVEAYTCNIRKISAHPRTK